MHAFWGDGDCTRSSYFSCIRLPTQCLLLMLSGSTDNETFRLNSSYPCTNDVKWIRICGDCTRSHCLLFNQLSTQRLLPMLSIGSVERRHESLLYFITSNLVPMSQVQYNRWKTNSYHNEFGITIHYQKPSCPINVHDIIYRRLAKVAYDNIYIRTRIVTKCRSCQLSVQFSDNLFLIYSWSLYFAWHVIDYAMHFCTIGLIGSEMKYTINCYAFKRLTLLNMLTIQYTTSHSEHK